MPECGRMKYFVTERLKRVRFTAPPSALELLRRQKDSQAISA